MANWLQTEDLPAPLRRRGGMSGCLANPTPDAVSEPKFCVDVSDEHTPINLPDSHRIFLHDYDATVVATTEDLDVSRHTAAASRVRTLSKLGSFGNSIWKQWADYESVDSRNSFRETCADLERETIVVTLSGLNQTGREIETKTL